MINLNNNDIGQLIEIELKDNIKHIGYLVLIENDFLKIKLLDNGYNIGINKNNIKGITKKDKKISLGKPSEINVSKKPNLKSIAYIGTGGTIGTHIDYRTGGVYMCRTPKQILSTVPELKNIINISYMESEIMKGSEDLTPKDWIKISKSVYNFLNKDDVNGIIITHGTDTLSFTATAISFMIENINKPVLLVGAQRSPDRASFDGSFNLICASHFSKEDISGVYTIMHGSINDDFCLAIRGTKSKKMHTSRRDSFRPINNKPIAKIYKNGKIEYLVNKNSLKNKNKPILKNTFEEKVAIIKAYPNADPKIIDYYLENNYKGLVIEGTALGHVPTLFNQETNEYDKNLSFIPYIKKATQKGMILVVSSQSPYGRVNSKVYSNLRDAEQNGLEYLDQHDMLTEVLYIKLGVALSRFKNKKDIINYLKTPIAGEITKKEIVNDYKY